MPKRPTSQEHQNDSRQNNDSKKNNGLRHESVFLQETLSLLQELQPQTHIDATLGAGGHARSCLEEIPSITTLVGIDRDARELARTAPTLVALNKEQRVFTHHGNFMSSYHDLLEGKTSFGPLKGADSILLDLGCSSMQLDDPERGFSFRYDAPLDMRMDQSEERSAADLVRECSQEELTRIIREYGEDRYASLMAKKICAYRETRPILTTFDLIRAAGLEGKQGRRHPATRLFQALRIALNDELAPLNEAIRGWLDFLFPGGRMVVLTFHSLEDRLIKQSFRQAHDEGRAKLHQRKAIKISWQESQRNPRARSAKLRWIEKI